MSKTTKTQTVVVLRTQPNLPPSRHVVVGRRGRFLRLLALDGLWSGQTWTANETTSVRILSGQTNLA